MPASIPDLTTVFERSPELVSRLVPLLGANESPETIVAKARGIIDGLGERERVATLNAHPRIGDDVRALSELSRREQGDDAGPETLTELARLNEAYERRFGFRFVVFVNGRSKREIVPVLRARLARTRDEELATGIDEFLRISRARLEAR